MEQHRLRPHPLSLAVQLGFLSAAQALDVLDEIWEAGETGGGLPPHALTSGEHGLVAKEVLARTPHIGQVLLMNGLISGTALRDELMAHRDVLRLERSSAG